MIYIYTYIHTSLNLLRDYMNPLKAFEDRIKVTKCDFGDSPLSGIVRETVRGRSDQGSPKLDHRDDPTNKEPLKRKLRGICLQYIV